ncbi:MAG: hypothetical protein EOM59_17240 [Clostridia bacterium]|nr:hypothetical protein [Clostridia bacterium]
MKHIKDKTKYCPLCKYELERNGLGWKCRNPMCDYDTSDKAAKKVIAWCIWAVVISFLGMIAAMIFIR